MSSRLISCCKKETKKKATPIFYCILISCYPLNCAKKIRALKDATKLALSGRSIYNGISEQALTTNFELLNLVPSDHPYHSKVNGNQGPGVNTKSSYHREKRFTSNTKTAPVVSATKWRRVGLVSASSVQLDTIVWPGGDIVVSGKRKSFVIQFYPLFILLLLP